MSNMTSSPTLSYAPRTTPIRYRRLAAGALVVLMYPLSLLTEDWLIYPYILHMTLGTHSVWIIEALLIATALSSSLAIFVGTIVLAGVLSPTPPTATSGTKKALALIAATFPLLCNLALLGVSIGTSLHVISPAAFITLQQIAACLSDASLLLLTLGAVWFLYVVSVRAGRLIIGWLGLMTMGIAGAAFLLTVLWLIVKIVTGGPLAGSATWLEACGHFLQIAWIVQAIGQAAYWTFLAVWALRRAGR